MYERHPLSAAFPSMAATEQDALATDIKQHGQRDPITIYDGQILDGWHRYQACSTLEIEPMFLTLRNDVDPVAFVLSCNMHRRHLTSSQRAAAVVACNDWATVGRPGNNCKVTLQLTASEMAKQADVSRQTIQQAKTAQAAGLGDKVISGELSAEKAAEMAKPKTAKAVTPEPPAQPQPETVTISKLEYEELHSVLEEYKSESLATEAVFDADDKVSAAVSEIRKLTARVVLLESQKNGLFNQCNELKKATVSKDRQISKLQKELGEYKLAEVEK